VPVIAGCFKLVIFDCDGVLVDSEPIINRAHAQVLTACGYPITEEVLVERFCGMSDPETLEIIERTFYRLPRQHHKRLKSTNMLERLNEEIKRRTHVVRIFPNGDSCLRLVRALAVETHENWLEQHRYLNMDDLREHKKEALRRAA
jgi:beta-phosphoglucomutase-like phosphatase (HAD superfamily)